MESQNPSDPTAFALASQIVDTVNAGTFIIVYKGQVFQAQPGSGTMDTVHAPNSASRFGSGAIAGAVVGLVAALCLVGLVVAAVYRRASSRPAVTQSPTEIAIETAPPATNEAPNSAVISRSPQLGRIIVNDTYISSRDLEAEAASQKGGRTIANDIYDSSGDMEADVIDPTTDRTLANDTYAWAIDFEDEPTPENPSQQCIRTVRNDTYDSFM